jgi:hypothetical protein
MIYTRIKLKLESLQHQIHIHSPEEDAVAGVRGREKKKEIMCWSQTNESFFLMC